MAPDTQTLFLNQTLEKTKCIGLLQGMLNSCPKAFHVLSRSVLPTTDI